MTIALDRRIEVRRLTTQSDLDAIRDEWRQLDMRCPDLTPFSTWEWCSTVAEFYGGDRPFWVLTLRRDGELIGVAPFAEVRSMGLRVLQFIGSGLRRYPISDYQDLLVAPEYEDEALRALCDDLRGRSGWDMLYLQELPPTSKTPEKLMEPLCGCSWLPVLQYGSDVHFLPIEGDWDSYKATLSRTTRNDTGRLIRKLIAEKEASLICIDGDVGAVDAAMNSLFDLHTQRWQSKGLPGIFRTEQRREFDREVARRFARRGMLVLWLLNAGDRTIAAKYGFVRDGVQYHYAVGYNVDPEWSRFRLGAVMDMQIIRNAFDDGLRGVDFMRGEGHYKDHYRMKTALNREMLVFRSRRVWLHYRLARFARAAAAEAYRAMKRRRTAPAVEEQDR